MSDVESEDAPRAPARVEAVRDAVDPLRPMAACELRFAAQAPVVVESDRARIEQVLGNLMSNAMKFGGGKPIEILVEADADAARIAVRDHGIGSAPEDQERIFRPFERAVSERHAMTRPL